MLVIPAIDLSQGMVVRLAQGDPSRKTVYSDSPVATAERFVAAGAEMLHVVDLDAALTGEPHNADAVAAICASVPAPVQLGGGLRTVGAVEAALRTGAARVVVGTAAVRDERFLGEVLALAGPDAVVGALDARDGKVAISGWVESGCPVEEIGLRWRAAGLVRAIHTDVVRDGMGVGPNVGASVALARATGLRVIVSGGVATLDDVRRVRDSGEPLVEAVIIGRALYEGSLGLAEALRAAAGREE